MDEEQLRLDIAEALGKANTIICIQTALVSSLNRKAVLTNGEVATLSAVANETLSAMSGLPDDVRELAESVLRGFAKTWTKRVTRN
jgi:hypothetical protein